MKHKPLKHYIKLKVILFSIILSLISCEKDESLNQIETVGNGTVSKIDFNYFNVNVNHNDTYNRLNPLFDKNRINTFSSRNASESEPESDFTIITDNITLIQKNNSSYYTFQLLTNSDIEEEFYNLVLEVDNQQNIINHNIFKYKPDTSWLTDTSQPYSGGIAISDLNIDINTLFSLRRSALCVVGVKSYWECGDGRDHPPGHLLCAPHNNAVTEFIIELIYGKCSTTDTQQNYYTISPSADPDLGNNIGGGNYNDSSPTVPLLDLSLNIECNKVTSFLNNNQVNFQNVLQILDGFTSLNHEIVITADTQQSSVSVAEGTQGSGGVYIDPNPTYSYITISHTHDAFGIDPDGDGVGSGTLSVFSYEDLMTLARILHNNKLDPGTFVAFLPTNKGTRYALTINDPTKFLDLFFYKLVKTPTTVEDDIRWIQSRQKLVPLFKEYYDLKNSDRKIKESDTDNENVLKQFLTFLKRGDAGISIFETNANYDSFQPVRLNTLRADIDRTQPPCNN